MPNRKTRDRQLRRLHERRIMERRKQKRQRSLTMIIASVLVLSLTVGLVLILANRGSKTAASSPSSHPSATQTAPSTPTPTVQGSPGSNCGYTKKTEDSGKKGPQALPPFTIDVNKKYTATVVTSEGTFVVDLDPKAAPCTVNSFVYLADKHFYDGLTFHRIIKDFVIQGGDPTGTGSGGPGYSFNDELNNGLKYDLGAIAMANSGANTNGSQWFIVTGPQGESLPNSYSIFGKVGSGMDVVQKIGAVKTDSTDKPVTPVTPVTIEKVTIKES